MLSLELRTARETKHSCSLEAAWNDPTLRCLVFHFKTLYLRRCVRTSLQGDGRGARDALEQHPLAGLATPGYWERRCDLLGIVLLEPELQRRLEPGRPVCAAQVHAGQGLLHRLTATAPSGVARPPPAAVKGVAT